MRLVFGLCVVMVCINPIKDIISMVNELDIGSVIETPSETDKYDELFNLSYSSAEVDNLKSGIRQMLNDLYGIDGSECSVSVRVSELESGKRRLDEIFITLYGTAIFKNTAEIEEYFGNMFNCKIVTAIG